MMHVTSELLPGKATSLPPSSNFLAVLPLFFPTALPVGVMLFVSRFVPHAFLPFASISAIRILFSSGVEFANLALDPRPRLFLPPTLALALGYPLTSSGDILRRTVSLLERWRVVLGDGAALHQRQALGDGGGAARGAVLHVPWLLHIGYL